MLNRITLAAIFTLSFATYLFGELSVSVQILPLALFAILVCVRVFLSASDLNIALRSLFTMESLVFVFLLCLFMAGPSFESALDVSAGYWALFAVVLIFARIYMAVVPLEEVLEAFFWSGVVSVGIFLPLSFVSLLESIHTLERFSPFSLHPNLLGFMMTGYFCSMVWKVITGRVLIRVIAAIVGAVCGMMIFLASSRGSLVAIIVACLFAVAMAMLRARRLGRFKLGRVVFISAFIVITSLVLIRYSLSASPAGDYIDNVLRLTSSDRGLSSGLTGRTERWEIVLGVFADGTWLTGRGLRFTEVANREIDNSYLVILYELGLVPALLITWRFVRILVYFGSAYLTATDDKQKQINFAVFLLITASLVNNIVDRYLFGVGNPYSLIGLLFFAAHLPSSTRYWLSPARIRPTSHSAGVLPGEVG
jgi:O-antigen ligase